MLTDIYGDGLADLVMANKFGNTSGALTDLSFYVLPGRGDGRFGVRGPPVTGTPPCYQD